jgi:hypothetical protein
VEQLQLGFYHGGNLQGFALWDGMLSSYLGHDTREFGLMLALDTGTLSLNEDDRCLGVMMRGL